MALTLQITDIVVETEGTRRVLVRFSDGVEQGA
jgi:hypothetical protein